MPFRLLVVMTVLAVVGCKRGEPSTRSAVTGGPKCSELGKSDDPASAAYMPLIDFVYVNQAFDRARFDALTPAQRNLWATWNMDGEVNNGGFNQYFFNTEGKEIEDAIAGFERFGATAKKDLALKARIIWLGDKERLAKVKEQGTLEAFSESYDSDPYKELDTAWYELSGGEEEKYVRAHPSEFCVP